jgi:ABC-type Fe3+-hydroxamate transport system substrate-binding protein
MTVLFRRRTICLCLLALLLVSAGVTSAQETKCSAGFRLIEHTMGKTCVSENPQRVVALEWTYVEDLLALGIQPVGIADIEGYHDWVKIPLALDEDVADVGDRSEPNLEVITGLEPDLIIAVNFRVTENYDDLSAIAPTLVFDPYPADFSSQYDEMINTFNTLAQVTNREAEGQAVLDHMNGVFAQAEAVLDAAGRGGEGFILSQSFAMSEVPTFRLFTDNSMAVQILEQIGIHNDWDDQTPQLYGFSTVDMEAFNEVGDTNFFYVAQGDYNETLGDSPIWNALPFVQSGRAYYMGGDIWLFGGPLSAEEVVKSVLSLLDIQLPEATPEA